MSVTSELRRRVRAEQSFPRYEPCLPRPAKQPPNGPGWLHEIKHDGMRIMARRDSGGVRLKARGVVLGNPRLADVRDRAVANLKADADRFAKNVAPIIREIQSTGVRSHRAIARSLNSRGIATARGGEWTALQRLSLAAGCA
jgi:hypothetical protein